MLSPVHDVRQEKAELQKIPLFNPRFRAAFPALAPRAILSIAGILLAAGIWWLAPWRHGYTSDERVKIWFGIAVMPFAAVLVSSFVVEYLLKSMQVAWWAIRRALVLNPTARLLGSIALGLLVTGAGLAVSGGDRDAWGFVGLFLGIFLSYWFVTTAWDLNERRRAPNQPAEPPAAGITPRAACAAEPSRGRDAGDRAASRRGSP